MAALNDEEPGFWPGYVAAVSGLVQGLLVMAMALGAAIFALGQLAQLPPQKAGSPPQPRASHDPAGFVPPEPLPVMPQVQVGKAGPAPVEPPVEGAEVRINAGFQGDAVILPTSAVPELIARIDNARAAGARRWRISIPADVDNPRQQRAAYLRLLGLRALMLRQGIAAGDIDVWIDQQIAGPGATSTAIITPLSEGTVTTPAGTVLADGGAR